MYQSQIQISEDLELLQELKRWDPTFKLSPVTTNAMKKKVLEAKAKDSQEKQNVTYSSSAIMPVMFTPKPHSDVFQYSAPTTNDRIEKKSTEVSFEDLVKRINDFEENLKNTTRTEGSIAALLKWDIRFESSNLSNRLYFFVIDPNT